GQSAGTAMSIVGVVLMFGGFYMIGSSWKIPVAAIASGIVLFLFARIMPRYSVKGAEALWKIKGFKLFMETVEQYRQQWNEKQNFFETMLPYAIAFDLTKQWIAKMEGLGAVPAHGYMPVWYIS